MDLLELALVGIHGEADEALRAECFGYGVRIGVRLAVVRELKIGVRGERRGAGIADFQRNVDHVAAAAEGIDLLHLQPVLAGGRETKLERVTARRQRPLAGQNPP